MGNVPGKEHDNKGAGYLQTRRQQPFRIGQRIVAVAYGFAQTVQLFPRSQRDHFDEQGQRGVPAFQKSGRPAAAGEEVLFYQLAQPRTSKGARSNPPSRGPKAPVRGTSRSVRPIISVIARNPSRAI